MIENETKREIMERKLKVLRSEYGMTTDEQVNSVVLSILSDAQEELSMHEELSGASSPMLETVNDKINFVKYVLMNA